MRATPMTILAVFAHPDDETGIGSTLAYYCDHGAFTVLVCASRGEAATIFCDDCATRENLADVRTHELECATRHLGIAELRWLDWPDGGISALPRDSAVRRIVAQIREIHPDVIITHPENGLYPHPDHLAIWEMVHTAFDAAADPGQYPMVGEPWAAARLFTRALPQSFFDAAPDFAAYRVELNGQRLPFYATPDDEIDVVMQVKPWADRRMAAWDCHHSQQNPDSGFARMPDGLRREMAENEHFLLAASRKPLPAGASHDLLAGLDGIDERAGEYAFADVLQASLAARRGYLDAYKEYLRQNPKPELAALLDKLSDPEQETIYELATALRRIDRTPGSIAPDPKVVAQALSCKSSWSRGQFLRAGAQNALLWYQEHLESAESDEERALWETMRRMAEAELAAVRAFISATE
jgi:mycothiol S-conjugate amidase